MAAFQKENGTAKGRGFGTVDGVPSFMNRFKTWITKAPSAGGPGWYIIDDQSAALDPYIVVSDVSAPTNANRGKIVSVSIPLGTSDIVRFRFWLWWNVTTHSGTSNYSAFTLSTLENSEYEYNFRGGPEGLLIMTRLGSTWDWVFIDEWEGDSNLVESASIEGSLTQEYALDAAAETGDNNNQVGGYNQLTGIGQHLDANGKLYFSVTVSGASSQIFIYKDSARTQLIAQTSMSSTIGSANVTAQNSSGVSGSINRTAVVANDTDIEVDFGLQLGAGQGAQFTVGRHYYIWDVENGARVAYVKVLAVLTDKLVVDGINNANFNAGSRISPYGHRWLVWGNQITDNGGFFSNSNPQIPYTSFLNANPSNLAISDPNNSSGIRSGWDYLSGVISSMDPDDEGRYAVMRPVVREVLDRVSNGDVNVNRVYGRMKNIYITSSVGLAQMLDGRVINSNNFLCFHLPGGSVAYLYRDYTSLS